MSTSLTTFKGSALDEGNYSHTITVAERLAKSDLLPPHFKNKPENVLLVLALAQNLDINPVMALQQISVISGKPCLQATLMISLLNKAGCLKGPLRFETMGSEGTPSQGCRAYGIDAETGEKIEGQTITLAMAQAEGWTRNPKYKSLPALMLQWRAASFFIRAYYPQVVMGLHTAEEMEDVQVSQPRDVTPTGSARARLAELKARQFQAGNGEQGEPATTSGADAASSVVHETPKPETSEADEILTDFLLGVQDITDADELTAMVENANSFEPEEKAKMAKRAIQNRAKAMGVTWDKATNKFVKA
ncbi:MAG: hypothetical protein WCL08_00395 [Verrucomicrobiota bacterium]